MDAFRAEMARTGFRTYVDPAQTADAYAMLVDSLGREDRSLAEAVEWSERSKLWNIRRDDWRPIVAPVQSVWVYPFASSTRQGSAL